MWDQCVWLYACDDWMNCTAWINVLSTGCLAEHNYRCGHFHPSTNYYHQHLRQTSKSLVTRSHELERFLFELRIGEHNNTFTRTSQSHFEWTPVTRNVGKSVGQRHSVENFKRSIIGSYFFVVKPNQIYWLASLARTVWLWSSIRIRSSRIPVPNRGHQICITNDSCRGWTKRTV